MGGVLQSGAEWCAQTLQQRSSSDRVGVVLALECVGVRLLLPAAVQVVQAHVLVVVFFRHLRVSGNE